MEKLPIVEPGSFVRLGRYTKKQGYRMSRAKGCVNRRQSWQTVATRDETGMIGLSNEEGIRSDE